jgi:hypothetical protein
MTQVQHGNNRVRYTHWGRYTSVNTVLGNTTRPMAILRVHTQSGLIDIPALIDSGADVVVFPQTIADAFGTIYNNANQTQLVVCHS